VNLTSKEIRRLVLAFAALLRLKPGQMAELIALVCNELLTEAKHIDTLKQEVRDQFHVELSAEKLAFGSPRGDSTRKKISFVAHVAPPTSFRWTPNNSSFAVVG
jgi:hypothetical protein